ncbi:MAG: hypothetical protein HQL54_03025 [Magnetococcales bacterium]|nr:hypothetical protein [Magnetococcales bacterium]
MVQPTRHLKRIELAFPGIWRDLDAIYLAKSWPNWCYVPIQRIARYLAKKGLDSRLDLSAQIAALSAWRSTQGVYRFHPQLLRAILRTPVRGRLPIKLLFLLPEWCVYLSLPRCISIFGHQLIGFFAHLDIDDTLKHRELRLLLENSEGDLIPIPIILANDGLESSIRKTIQKLSTKRAYLIQNEPGGLPAVQIKLGSLISAVLYLIAENRELIMKGADPETPYSILPKRSSEREIKKGPRFFPPENPVEWHLGQRFGTLMNKAQQCDSKAALLALQKEFNAVDSGSYIPPIHPATWQLFWVAHESHKTMKRPAIKWIPSKY